MLYPDCDGKVPLTMPKTWRAAPLAVALALLALAAPAAVAAPSAMTDQGEVRLLAARTATGGQVEQTLGLKFTLKPGWKVYWRHAGDAGYPPSIDWGGSQNLQGAEFRWPLPHRFEVLGLQSLGYKDEVVLPLKARLADPAQPAQLRAKVDYLVCAEICVPQTVDLSLVLPDGPGEPGADAHEIGRWEARVPGDGAAHGLRLERVEAVEMDGAPALRATVRAEPPLSAAPDLFVEAEGRFFGPPAVRLSEGGQLASLTVPQTQGEGGLAGVPVTVTLADGGLRGLEAQATPVPGTAEQGTTDWGGLAAMLGIALLGGLILNLMPCVLPVLSLKVLGLVGHGGAERAAIRRGFVASAAGILVSFLLLAGAALAVKTAGLAVGWGIQFQQPLFLVAMTGLLTLFAANLWGWLEIPLPAWLGGVGAGHGAPHGLAGHFATGALATLLATPCSAPFLGTAVGFALARGPVEILAIFAALGLGMGLPYLLVAAFPGLARRLPRPGPWMITLRRVLGLALGGTAVWLLTVLAAQAGLGAAGGVAGLMVLLLALLGCKGRLPRPAVLGGIVAVLALSLAVPVLAGRQEPAAKPGAALGWEPFDPAAIPRHVAQGKLVFVDVTADWCITCQVNKKLVLDRGEVADFLSTPGTVAMRGDWTSPDAGIANYLSFFGRYGIPFNAIYGPGAPEGIALPEVLTEAAVLEAIRGAR